MPKHPRIAKKPRRIREANTTLVQMNASYLDPNGAFQKSLRESFKESLKDDTKAMLESLRQEHAQRMLELEQQYGAKHRELSAKENDLKVHLEAKHRELSAKENNLEVHLEAKEREITARFEKLQVGFMTISL